MLQSRLLTDIFISIPNTKPFQYILFNSLPVPASMVGSSRFHRSSKVKAKLCLFPPDFGAMWWSFTTKSPRPYLLDNSFRPRNEIGWFVSASTVFTLLIGMQLLWRSNAVSVSIRLQQLLKYQHWRPSRNLTTELGIKDHVTNMWNMTLIWMVHAVIINEMWH